MTRQVDPHSDFGRCPYCGGTPSLHFSAPDVNQGIGDVVFHLLRCTGCGLLFIANPPSDLSPYYTADYHWHLKEAADLAPHLPGQRFKMELVQRFQSGGSLLEIGPSIGIFCRLAKVAGFDVSAIELDADCARFLNEQLGVRTVHSGDPAAVLAAEDRHYDVICLWHSVEHLPEPWRVLEQAALHLNQGGVLVVGAPNPDAWQAAVMGARWPHWDLPRHLFELPIPWLSALGTKLGLIVELTTTRDAGSLYWNRFAWAMVFQSRSRFRLIRRPLWRLGMVAGWLLQPWEGREGIGSAYTIVMRRP